jgi:hypothetical protein
VCVCNGLCVCDGVCLCVRVMVCGPTFGARGDPRRVDHVFGVGLSKLDKPLCGELLRHGAQGEAGGALYGGVATAGRKRRPTAS